MLKKTIGVIGGMGPESTALFYKLLIIECQKQYNAKYDEDFPEIIIINLPIPDPVSKIENPERTVKMMAQTVNKLQTIGAAFVVMPCNTSHYFYDEVSKRIGIPFLNMLSETSKKIEKTGKRKVGILATNSTIKYKLYDDELSKKNIEFIVPEQQDKLNAVIYNILSGKKLQEDETVLRRIIDDLLTKGAEGILIGCTDIPVLLNKDKYPDVLFFDSLDILAESTIRFAIN
jgi:aspartate racemase